MIPLVWNYRKLSTLPPPKGVHDLSMDGGLPPGFQQTTLFLLPTVAVILVFMMNFGGKMPIFYNCLPISGNPPMLKENLPKKGPLLRKCWTQNPPTWFGMLCYPLPGLLGSDSNPQLPCYDNKTIPSLGKFLQQTKSKDI